MVTGPTTPLKKNEDSHLGEQTIRPFTIVRKNWVYAYSIHEAMASAVFYSIVGTAKANDIKVYDHLEYLIGKLAEHTEDTGREFSRIFFPALRLFRKNAKNVKILIHLSRC